MRFKTERERKLKRLLKKRAHFPEPLWASDDSVTFLVPPEFDEDTVRQMYEECLRLQASRKGIELPDHLGVQVKESKVVKG